MGKTAEVLRESMLDEGLIEISSQELKDSTDIEGIDPNSARIENFHDPSISLTTERPGVRRRFVSHGDNPMHPAERV